MRISVIILYRNQSANLPHILSALARQSRRIDEVLVVDDQSELNPRAAVEYAGCSYLATGAHLTARRGGMRALARQLGADAARFPALAYLDGDMIPGPRFIEHGITALRSASLVKPWREFRITRDGRVERTLLNTDSVDAILPLRYESFTSDCFLLRRTDLLEVGGWDSHFCGWGEEDVELAYRMQRTGMAMVSLKAPGAFATHIDHPVDSIANCASLLRNANYFAQKHPEVLRERSAYWTSLGVYETSYRRGTAALGPTGDTMPTQLSPPL